ncbi:MAG: hypothetical protein LBC60_06275, partial [Spirochaetaceae bacterium]|nr:hypothetical protein [Spirochaetaceae bacterium]
SAGNIVFAEGVYKAAGTVTIDAASGEISGDAAASLALGDNGAADAKPLTLAGGATSTGTFTAGADARVTLSGTGDGAVVVTPTGGAGAFILGATAELKLGDGVIALGYDGGNRGSLSLTDGAKVSGFTYKGTGGPYTLHDGTAVQQHSFTVASIGGRAVLGKYYTDGVAITEGDGVYTYDAAGTLVGTITAGSAATSYAAAPIHGGIIHKGSDVAH